MTFEDKKFLGIIIILLYIPYLLLYLFEDQYPLLHYVEGVPALVAILLLFKFGGFSREDLYLSKRRISQVGIYLIVLVVGGVIVIGFFGQPGIFNYQSFFLLAPVSAITQELYFRCSLQVCFERIYKCSFRNALILQSIIFIGWHLRLFVQNPNAIAWLGLIAGLGFLGMVWGYQSRKDGTILYVMLIHIFGLMGHSLFLWNITI